MSDDSGYAKNDVTLMDIWLVIRSYRRFVFISIILITVLGVIIAFSLPNQYQFTTAIEIGNQVVNDEIIPIEASETVVDKLRTGYIPVVVSQFVPENPSGPDEYIIEVIGSDNSQVVQVVSEAPINEKELITDLHNQIVSELIKDHNRTIDSMRANAKILLAEANQKLGEVVSEEQALKMQLDSIDETLQSLENYTNELNDRILSAEKEITKLRLSDSDATKILMLTTQIGEWQSNLVGIENQAKVNIYVVRAEAEKSVNNANKGKQTAQNEIEYRETVIKNIQDTRVLGKNAVVSLKPVSPDKLLIIFGSLIFSLMFAVFGSLILDFLKRSKSL